MQAVEKAKEYNSDFLGFTEKLHRTNLSAWQTLGPDWRKAFCTAEVEIVVDAKIVQTRMIGE
ncbi:Ger(x)C family spore germination C-terminal domain-containing protein [Dehalobacter sp. 4CP]|uniref:Ger(x)C family spore germination C-terminal domain-containing protein n=1 Tax=Dehalobacter sp. CP TaxID=2594474 RepID=UPI0039EAC69B